MFSFTVTKKLGNARLSELTTPHGTVNGPFFQFVATQAAIRGMVTSEDLEKMGVQIVLANTYHLHLRPGEDVIAEAGGLHDFMQWDRPITTDSGGYQVFSLGDNVMVDDGGVTFRAPLDGSLQRFTPEKVVQIQAKLGADLVMPLDVCTRFGATRKEVEQAIDRTTRWARRCKEEYERRSSHTFPKDGTAAPAATVPQLSSRDCQDSPAFRRGSLANQAREIRNVPRKTVTGAAQPQVLYGIVQGGVYSDLRERAAAALREIGFFGYCIGGELQDGKEKRLHDVVSATTARLPENAPRYLMGYGRPEDIVEAVRAGVDQFDCVLPVRNGRHGQLYYDLNNEELEVCLGDPERPIDASVLYKRVDIMRAAHTKDHSLVSPDHPVITKDYSRAYIHHLMRSETPSGVRFCVLHNIYFYVRLMESIRNAIAEVGQERKP